MKNYAKKLENFLEEYVKIQSISFLRENPRVFALRHFKIFSVLLFSPNGDIPEEGLKEKLLYSVWNNVIDDIIEYTDRGKKNILESLEALLKLKKRKKFNMNTESGKIMYNFIQKFKKLSFGPNKEISKELLFLDLTRIINGFHYEKIIQKNDEMGTFSEYMEFGAITIDTRILLDIDIGIYPYKLNLSTIGNLREAYKWFSLAFKLISDIATFEREYFVEKSQNSIILHGQKKGLLPMDILKKSQAYKEHLFEKNIPLLMEEIKDIAKKHLSVSLKYLNSINEVDTNRISLAFTSMFNEYPGLKKFSYPQKGE